MYMKFLPVLQIPMGIGISVTIRVGKELGAGNPRGAKRASFIAVAIARKDVPILAYYLREWKC